jgi:hypothetical protein
MTKRVRCTKGAVLVEGVVSICLMITATMIAVSFLVSSGMMVYYKQKIGFVADQVAHQVGLMPTMDDMTVQEMTRDMLVKIGISTADLTVTRKASTVYGRPAVEITIRNGKLPLFSNVDFLPMSIEMQDKSVALLCPDATGAEAYYWNTKGRTSSYLVPLVKMPPGGPNVLTLPIIQN